VDQFKVIKATKYWLENTIIKFNFCPFAKREFINQTIQYYVSDKTNDEERLCQIVEQLKYLDKNDAIETTLVIFPQGLENFFDYLDFLSLAEEAIQQLGYEGTYQLASFHPQYYFEDLKQDDPANYTNRSPFPVIHILRESSIEIALGFHDDPEAIPHENVITAREMGADIFVEILRHSLG